MRSLLFLILFSSCSFIPEMEKIPSPVPKDLPVSETMGEGPSIPWKEFYRHQELQRLIARSLKFNRDMKTAVLNMEEVRANYRIQKSNSLPTVDLRGSWTRRELPEEARFAPDEQYALEVGITSYELDFFGRIRSLNESALQEYFSSKAAKDTVKVSLISEVAATYLKLLCNRELEKLSIKTAKAQEETVKLIKRRFRSGVASELEVRQAETLLQQARSDAIAFSRQTALDENALELLAGYGRGKKRLLATFDEVAKTLAVPPMGISSKVLLKRPDVRQAERLLLAANANIGAARAAFFPSISLTTSAGKLSTEASDLFDSDSNSWSFMPQIRVPIFTGGRNEALLDLVRVRKNRRIAEYERTIQVAFREASDAIVSNGKLLELLKAQEKVVNAASTAHRLGKIRYDSGIDNYLVELDARRALYQAQQAQLNQKLTYYTNLTFLYRALGGGLN